MTSVGPGKWRQDDYPPEDIKDAQSAACKLVFAECESDCLAN